MANRDPDYSSDEDGGQSPSLADMVLNDAPKRPTRADEWLLPGEEVIVRENNIGYLSLVGKLYGSVVVTNYRLRFRSKDQTASGKSIKQCEFYVTLGSISRVEKVGHSTVSRGEDAYGLEISCKDFRTIKFSSRQENHSRRPLFESIQKYAFPLSNKLNFFALTYRENSENIDGWSIYDPIQELRRQGIPNDTWVISRINEKYEFSETYPSILCVPATAEQMGEEFLQRVGAFRSKSRIPVLSWVHPESQASITRSSQPLVGMTGRRSEADETALRQLIDANAQSAKLAIMDARPEVNAKVNKAKGGGYEGQEAYESCELVFLDIQNIHVMRESLRKLREICYSRIDDKTWLSSLDETNWLEHIKLILTGAARIVDKVENHKTSVLVHCSDGWDRTAQLTGLSLCLLDSYYRTLIGFQVLIEKEWCSFGHQFAKRMGHGEDKHSDAERSPVFIQFIDAVWQLTQQFPTAFEFNSHFLITILDELFSCRFGTFLGNCERVRVREIKGRTVSLWTHVNNRREDFLNPLYSEETCSLVLIPSCSQRRIKLWNQFYLRHNPSVNCTGQPEELSLIYRQLLKVKESLRNEVEALRSSGHPQPQVPPKPSLLKQ